MKRVTETDAKNRLDAILDEAQREPVVIHRQGQDVAVIVSVASYERLRAEDIEAFLQVRRRVAAEAAANGLTEAEVLRLTREGE